MFHDRFEAGKKLAQSLQRYRGAKDTVVVGLPRGGVVVAAVVAKDLQLPLEVLICRKIGARYNPEFAVGAVCEGGQSQLSEAAELESKEYLMQKIAQEFEEIALRQKTFRGGGKLNVKDKTVILADDGIATGQTVLAAIAALKNLGAKKIIVAAPVAASDTVESLKQTGAEIIVLETPPHFMAVGQFYQDFPQVSDEEVKELLANSK